MINTGNDVNVVNLTGNLMCDVTWKTDAEGNKIVGFFAVGTTRKLKGEFVSDRHSIVVKGPVIANFPEIKKGSRVAVQGVLTYVKREGAPYPSAEIKLETIKLLSP
jgi:hypothetical protein